MVLGIWRSTLKYESRFLFLTLKRIQFQAGFNVRAEILKLLKQQVEKTLEDTCVGKDSEELHSLGK